MARAEDSANVSPASGAAPANTGDDEDYQDASAEDQTGTDNRESDFGFRTLDETLQGLNERRQRRTSDENNSDKSSKSDDYPLDTDTRFMVGGLAIELVEPGSRGYGVADQGPLYRKENREKMSSEKKQDLFKEAVKTSQTKYTFTSMSLTDEKKLDECYNTSIMISKTKDTHMVYDMHDVFTIVFPKLKGSRSIESRTVDLYLNYEEVTPDEVAASCEWYRRWTKKDWYRENLVLTYKHLENNMTQSLFEKCYEQFETYPTIQQGGPLLFVIMMNILVSSSEAAIDHLKDLVKNLKINEFQGENVLRVVSLIRGAHKRLKWVKKVPERFNQQVLKVMQTSSVGKFNSYFRYIEQTYTMARDIGKLQGDPDDTGGLEVDVLLRLAETKYNELCSSNDWHGSKTKGKNSVFNAQEDAKKAANTASSGNGKPQPICWNCGKPGHTAPKCTEPRNEQKIAANKEKFGSKKAANGTSSSNSGAGGASGKWAPPKSDERNRRVIDGKHMFYNHRTHRWVPDRTHSSNQDASAHAARADNASTTSTLTGATGTVAGSTVNRAELDAAVANVARSVDQSLRSLVEHFS